MGNAPRPKIKKRGVQWASKLKNEQKPWTQTQKQDGVVVGQKPPGPENKKQDGVVARVPVVGK